jgi:hypothetical protein
MGNPVLDQFMQQIWIKVVPIGILASLAAMFLRKLLR